MSEITITIKLGNDSMQTATDAVESIRQALHLGRGTSIFEPLAPGENGTILDAFGNTVGTWTVKP